MTGITQATPAQFHDALTSGTVLLVDVREPNEYALERIPGALLYPLSTFDPQAISGAGHKLAVHCAGGVRSLRAAQALVASGHTHVINLDGGIKAWKAAGLPLIRIDPLSGQVVQDGR